MMAFLHWYHLGIFLAAALAAASAATLDTTPEEPIIPDEDGEFESINPTHIDGKELFEGDILLSDDQRASQKQRKAISSLTKRWTNGPDGVPVVPYIFKDDQVDQTKVGFGIAHWMEHTCIKFELTDANEINPHLQFIKGSGCWSFVGKLNRAGQEISIGNGCGGLGTVVHEIGHSLGFFHEQSRSDRDDFVHIIEENILDGRESNFNKQNDNNYSLPYDYTSDMHYRSKAFSKNRLNTIVALNPLAQTILGKRTGLSHYDKLMANTMYPCIEKWLATCNMTEDPCENDGYTGSDCKCACRRGTSGANCETVEKGYYDSLYSDCSEEMTAEGTVTSPGYPTVYSKGLRCVKWIRAPEHHVVSITFNDFNLFERTASCSNNSQCCYYDSLEMRTSDLNVGDMYCGSEISPGESFTSTSNQMILSFETRKSLHTGWTADVKFVSVSTDCSQELVSDDVSHWSSPRFGNRNYPDNVTCKLSSISSTSPSWARIQFNNFDLESSVNGSCKDYISFSRPYDFGSEILCGARTEDLKLPSYNFEADFVSDDVINDSGFNVTVTRESSGCHRVIETGGLGSAGIIRSPRKANDAWMTKACEWWIRAPEGLRIKLKVKKFRTTATKCVGSRVIVNGEGDNKYPGATSVHYCKSDKRKAIKSEANEMNVLFYSNVASDFLKARWVVISG